MVLGIVGLLLPEGLREREHEVDADDEEPHLRREDGKLHVKRKTRAEIGVLVELAPEDVLRVDAELDEEAKDKIEGESQVRDRAPEEQRQRRTAHGAVLIIFVNHGAASDDRDARADEERGLRGEHVGFCLERRVGGRW